MAKIRVLVVDDNRLIRKMLIRTINESNIAEVIGEANDAFEAREHIIHEKPDVMTLDIHMPKMDGLDFLERVMAHIPLNIVVISSLTTDGSRHAMEAFDKGAVEVIAKPDASYQPAQIFKRRLINALQSAASVRRSSSTQVPTIKEHDSNNNTSFERIGPSRIKALAIGSSTGGPAALIKLLSKLPEDIPPTFIIQHMPPMFTTQFAQRLNKACRFPVHEAKHNMSVQKGHAYLAPGDFHMLVKGRPGNERIVLTQSELIHHQRPAVDPSFISFAHCYGKSCIGIILTGMGKDGAQGCVELYKRGAHIICQDERSSLIYGMPKAALKLVPKAQSYPLEEIPEKIYEWARLDSSQ